MSSQNLTLLTDLYELTMMQGYFETQENETVIFDMFFRENPNKGGYSIMAGLEQVIEYIKNLKHHHLVMSGLTGRDLALVQQAWPYGNVDVRSLRELTDNFEDTCRYLLKERKPKGKRAYSTSNNLKRPPEPLKRRVSERADIHLPPGVKLVDKQQRDTDCGRYQIVVGKIVDMAAFDQYWIRAQQDRRRIMEAEHWAKYARQKRRGANGPYLARNGV